MHVIPTQTSPGTAFKKIRVEKVNSSEKTSEFFLGCWRMMLSFGWGALVVDTDCAGLVGS